MIELENGDKIFSSYIEMMEYVDQNNFKAIKFKDREIIILEDGIKEFDSNLNREGSHASV